MLTLATAPSTGGLTGHPDNDTDHGVANQTFHALWSGDADGAPTVSNSSTDATALAQLATATDLPLDRPPRAVERWNRGDHAAFPTTSQNRSVHPPDANRTNGTVVRDAYVETFAVQPSTRARLSPTGQPWYVAPNGSVLATVDYRIDPPGPTTTESWSSRVVAVRLYVDGEREAATNGSHTPTLSYDALDEYRGRNHTLTVEADIVATPAPLDCPANGTRECGANVTAERVTVRDTVNVTVYDLSVSGYRASYPNGDTGLVVYKSDPWLGYEVPGGDVRGVWRFYAARDADWDTLVTRTSNGTRTDHSPLHPVQMYAYPIETGPTPTPRGEITILDVFGDEREPPTLPEHVNLDVVTQPYTASYGLAARVDANVTRQPFRLEHVRALGLVRGVNATATESSFATTPVNRTNLMLTVVNRSAETVTVRIALRDAATGEPVATTDRRGSIVVANQTVNTTANGTVTTTLSRQGGTLSARFDPGPWWRETTGYTASSDVAYVGGTVIRFLQIVYRLSVPVSLFLGAVFLIDRMTGWHVWPPWRGL